MKLNELLSALQMNENNARGNLLMAESNKRRKNCLTCINTDTIKFREIIVQRSCFVFNRGFFEYCDSFMIATMHVFRFSRLDGVFAMLFKLVHLVTFH